MQQMLNLMYIKSSLFDLAAHPMALSARLCGGSSATH